MSKLSALILLTTVVSTVSGANICAYTSRDCLPVTYGCCSNIAAGTCCTYPKDYGWSTKFTNMPAGRSWVGTTYGDTCRTSTGGGGSTGTVDVCVGVYNSPTYLNARSASWIFRDTRSIGAQVVDSPCQMFNTIGFTDNEGASHEIGIPKGRTFDEMEKLVEAGSYDEVWAVINNTD